MKVPTYIPGFADLCVALLMTASFAPALRAEAAADDFAQHCPKANTMFTAGPPSRKLASTASWQNDYPILIYDVPAGNAKLGYEAAQALMKTKTEELAKAEKAKAAADSKSLKAAQDSLDISKQGREDAIADVAAKKETLDQQLPGGPLFWVEPHGRTLHSIANPSFATPVFTTEKVLVLVCRSTFGDGISVSSTAVEVTGADDTSGTPTPQGLSFDELQRTTLDRVFVLDATKVKNNSLETVAITFPKDANHTDTLASVVLARHKVVHYSAGGGLLIINAPSTSYSLVSVPMTITTVMSQNSTTLAGGVSTGSSTQTSSATTFGAASYMLAQRGSSQGFNSVAGLTWYPFGHDTFPVTKASGLTLSYSAYHPKQMLGLFLGTTTNTFGNFTAAPAIEFFPGMQVFAGVTMRTKTTLLSGVVACSGYGTSPSFAAAPPASASSSTSTTASGVTTVVTTANTTTITQTTGCSNGDKANVFASGATSPTQTAIKPAFSFGVLFNTNLLSRFTGFGK